LARCFVADLPVGLARDEAHIGNIVRLAACVTVLEHRLWEDMMELKPMLCSRMVNGDGNLRTPILGAALTKR